MKAVSVFMCVLGSLLAILAGVLFYDSRPATALLHANVFDYTVEDILGRPHPIAQYKGHILLIMNVASECGFTDTGYATASNLYEKYSGDNFTVLAFPCDQFGGQEPGDSKQILDFAAKRKNPVTFPLMNKVNVNGPDASPLWEHLKNHMPGVLGTRSIKWNFSKFLVARDGTVRFRYDPRVTTEDIETDLQTLLYFRE